MTPEQYSMIIGKLTVLDTFMMAVAKTIPDQASLRREIATQRDTLEAALMNSEQDDAHIESVLARLDKLVAAIWG